ncbi:hypothetical protein A9Q96_12180 [Rhodobacterales bacterium 52_120_T64]|nr:hypothetical protein A9Q96_12180 [Rhodobacterales bacterium 52_120_T64]
MNKTVFALLAALALGACGSTAPNTNASDPINIVGTTNIRVDDVQVVDSAPHSAIEIAGIDCRNKLWDPVPTAPRAIETLKAEVRELGKTHVFVRSVLPHPSPISINCWSALEARGLAF